MERRLLVAVTSAALALTACNASPSSPSSSGSPSATGTGTPSPSATAPASVSPSASPSAAGTMRAAVYYLGGPADRPRLFREFRAVPRSTAVVRAAVDAMLHKAPLDTDYRSLWPAATTIRGISTAGTVATVDLSANARSVTANAAAEQASLQQLVYTVTAAAPSLTSVRLRFDGATKPTLWGHVSTSGSISRASASTTLSPVWVLTPAQGAHVSRTFTVTGTASVFEATVSWAVTRAGTTTQLAHGFVNAAQGAPARADFTVHVTLPAGTTGDVVFTAWEESAKDGSVTSPDSKPYRVA